jgi:hypothetical protein
MSLQLKMHGQDSLQAGWRYNTAETITMLGKWADYVIFMQPEMIERLKEKGGVIDEHKIRVVDVGLDVYHSNTHMGLNQYLQGVVRDWQSRNWEI